MFATGNYVPQSEVIEEEEPTKQKKKRTRNPENWKKEKRKRAILAGQAYVNTKGEIVGPRIQGPDCNCKHKCYSAVGEEQRKSIFFEFYSLKSYDEQNAYLYGLIRRCDIQRKRKPISERRTCSYKYYIRLKGKEIQVCKKAFANIHGISDRKIRTLCIKHEQNVLFPRDNRGRHNNRPKKVTPELRTIVKRHILTMLSGATGNSFIKKNDKSQVQDVNISKLHESFLQLYEPEAFEAETGKVRKDYNAKVKLWLYSKLFHEEFNSTDFNTVKRKLSDLRKSLEPQSQTVKKKAKPKPKARPPPDPVIPREMNHPSQNVPTISPGSMNQYMSAGHASYMTPQQQHQQPHFPPNIPLSMLGFQHLNSAGHHSAQPASFTPSQQQIQHLQHQINNSL